MTSEEPEISEVPEGLLDAFNAHDLDAIMGLFAEDCSFGLPRGPEPHGSRHIGREEVRRGIQRVPHRR